ncbi:hypothetical protein ABV409_15100 [Flagellimonas sp. DF-77]|uniref:hypothetical protein n=1 Tax=Flagellimonas algarum TaxID=3230298 RepID=UPI003391990E
MKTRTLVLAVGGTLMSGLLLLALCTKKPEDRHFDRTVAQLMETNGYVTHQQTMDSFPELGLIHSKMERMAYLNSTIHSMMAGPSPDVSEDEREALDRYQTEVGVLRRFIQTELARFMQAHAIHP